MLTYAYNWMRNNVTGFSPYCLLYGRHLLLHIDIEFGVVTPDLSETVTLRYVKVLQRKLEYAFRKAAAISKKEVQRSKRCYDKFAKCSKLEPGGFVLVRKKGFQDKRKIADHWEKDPYEVVKHRQEGLPVFVVSTNRQE